MIPFRVSKEPLKWQECAILVSEFSVAAAISWIEKMVFEPMVVKEVSCLDALLEAGKDKTVSVYPRLAQVTKMAQSLTYSVCVSTLLVQAPSGNSSIIPEGTCLSFLSSCYGNIPQSKANWGGRDGLFLLMVPGSSHHSGGYHSNRSSRELVTFTCGQGQRGTEERQRQRQSGK